jgi:hypothetical protein
MPLDNSSGGGGGGAGAIRAGRAFVEFTAKTGPAVKAIDSLEARFTNFGKAVKSIGSGIARGAVFGVGGSIAGGIISSVSSAAHAIPSMILGSLEGTAKQGQIAKALGLTSEQFTGIAGVARSVGEDTREFLESLVTMGKLGTDAAAGIGVAAQAFTALGLDAEAFVKLRADEQFFLIFEALSKVQDPLQKTRLLMNAFGEDGGKYLLPLLGKTPAELRNMARGFEVSGDAVEAATKANLAWQATQQQLTKVIGEMATEAAPTVERVANAVSQGFKDAKPAIEELTKAGIGSPTSS